MSATRTQAIETFRKLNRMLSSSFGQMVEGRLYKQVKARSKNAQGDYDKIISIIQEEYRSIDASAERYAEDQDFVSRFGHSRLGDAVHRS
tara:strand:+ start:3245 stop:3514 length:270 start_codon:yes stop_codon:yes gene_type:complete